MKSSFTIRFFTFFLLIFISFTTHIMSQDLEVKTCSDVDTLTCEPVDIKNEFQNNERFVTAFINMEKIPGGKKIIFRWISPNGSIYREAMGDIIPLPSKKTYPSFKAWNSIILKTCRASWLQGEWKVEVFLGENEIGSANFFIEKKEELPSEYAPPFKVTGPVFTQSDITGKITDIRTGEPLEGGEVKIGNILSISDKEGYFHLSSVPEGTHILEVNAPGYYKAIQNINIEKSKLLTLQVPCKKEGTAIYPVTADIQISETVYSGVYHLYPILNKNLITYIVTNNTGETKNIVLSSKIKDYTPSFEDTVEVPAKTTCIVNQTPPFHPKTLNKIKELTTAVATGKVSEIKDGEELLITEKSEIIKLLAKDTFVYLEKNPLTGKPDFLHKTIGAWMTTHITEIDELLGTVAENHPEKKITGYQSKELGEIEELALMSGEQAKAIYKTLQFNLGIIYTNSSTQYGADPMTVKAQRLRLPKDIIKTGTANCLEGTILFATLLEAAHLNPVIVIVSGGHAFVGWEKWDQAGEYDFLKTTDIGKGLPYEEALKHGNEDYEKAKNMIINGRAVFLDINSLRNENITPMK